MLFQPNSQYFGEARISLETDRVDAYFEDPNEIK